MVQGHLEFGGRTICAYCAYALMSMASLIEYFPNGDDDRAMFELRGFGALPRLVQWHDDHRADFPEGRFQINRADAGLFAVSFVKGTSVCHMHILAALEDRKVH